ncbi:MAG: toxic anion resistance protein, partial [Gammaproteobacteria bacterium]|nr:toxic anion resistance protein [Gammaproteobacteria bacterium]NDG88749.1 toxic anion resistance protein [Gammaproteobacteria bacterium]
DSALTQELANIDAKDQEKGRIIREELLFYIRQKVQDLLTQLAVTVQGYLAMDMVRKNNLELIKGVDRATTTTVSALRTAIIVAQALSNQKLVLNQIGALNNRTSDLIASTSTMMKHQAGAIHTQATSATLDIEHLKGAFENIYATMDMVASYKIQALDNMQKTVETLSIEVEKSKAYLDRTRDPNMDETLSSLTTEVQDPLQL